jgi:hypothetical protein
MKTALICTICHRPYAAGRRDAKTCSPECRKEHNRLRAFYHQHRYAKGERQCDILAPPSRVERERMMDGLHRLLLTTGDEVSLLFGQAQGLGRGIRYKGTEARI